MGELGPLWLFCGYLFREYTPRSAKMAEARRRVMQVSQEEMEAARIPLEYRDYCAHLLVPLNKCRVETFYLPWKCSAERHIYERCQYVEWQRRVKEKAEAEMK